jgi:proteasome alpha subunit
VMGGSVDSVQEYLTSHYSEGLDLAAALRLAADALGHEGTSTREVNTERLEVAVLDRTRTQPRKFRRVEGRRLADLFASTTPATTEPEPEPEPEPEAAPEATADADSPADAAPPPAEPTESTGADPADEIGDLPDDPESPPTHV